MAKASQELKGVSEGLESEGIPNCYGQSTEGKKFCIALPIGFCQGEIHDADVAYNDSDFRIIAQSDDDEELFVRLATASWNRPSRNRRSPRECISHLRRESEAGGG